MKKSIILFDIDYTLFDQGKYRQLVFQRFQDLLPNIPHVADTALATYEEIRKTGWFEIEKFTDAFLERFPSSIDRQTAQDVWKDQLLLDESVYPEALDVLMALSEKDFLLGLFSSGYTDFQRSKIDAIAHFFEEEHVHIHELKDEKLPEIAKKYVNDTLYIVDDYIPVIEKVKQANADIITIWMKRGYLSEQVAPSKKTPPDYIISDLTELLSIVESS